MPETAAGRALWGMFREKPAKSINEGPALVLAIEAEARALGRAEALAAVRAAVEGLPNGERCFCDADRRVDSDQLYVHQSAVLAAIDNLETPE